MKLHVNWGHASAQQLRRVSADSEDGNPRLVNFVGDVREHCETCRASGKAPHVPLAGTSTASMLNEKAQADLLFLGDIIALREMDKFPKYSLLLPVQSKNPREV